MIHGEPHHEYHRKRGLFLTSHLLIDAFGSPADFISAYREPRADTTSLYFGRAAHVWLLEGEQQFRQEYVVGGPVNPRTGKTFGTTSKKFKEWAGTQLLPAITPEEFDLIQRMAASVRRNKAAAELLRRGEPEVTGRCELEDVPCQVRLDWLTPNNEIVDYKTTSSIATFAVDAEQYGYLIQQAFYRQVVKQITGNVCPVYLLIAEKTPEAPALVWRLKDDLLDEQEQKNRSKIYELKDLFFRLKKEKEECQLSEPPSNPPMTSKDRPRQPKNQQLA